MFFVLLSVISSLQKGYYPWNFKIYFLFEIASLYYVTIMNYTRAH